MTRAERVATIRSRGGGPFGWMGPEAPVPGFLQGMAVLAEFGGGLALILGIDRFMSEARALTNLIGNGVATLVVAKWTGELDTEKLHAGLDNETWVEAQEPEVLLNRKTEHMAGTHRH